MNEPSIDEGSRRRFEAAWQSGQEPAIEDYLPAAAEENCLPTVEELIYIDLELAWKRRGKTGGGPLVESYLQRFPALLKPAEAGYYELVVRLIRAEYEARRDWGDRPSLDEYRRRFPQWIITGRELTQPPPPAVESKVAAENAVREVPAIGHVLIETIPSADRKSSRYTLSRLHAEGGLGRIWIAHDVSLNREVALKEIKPGSTKHAEVSQRFLKEAQIAGQLEHPNIVPVYELARRPEDNQPFYTMRLVRGQTLRECCTEYHRKKKDAGADPLELHRLLTAFVSICNAISFAHSKGVIHRDLKPENVVLGAFGEVLVLDWGLAKLTSEKGEETPQPVDITASAQMHATKAGQVLGTPAYMSPEQAAGRLGKIDARTDIYGLGAILFELLTGRPPHQGPDMSELISQIVLAPTPQVTTANPAAPRALSAICATAMARKQEDRYPSASALADDVQRYLADEPVSVYRAPLLDRAARLLRKHRTMALAAAAALLLVAVVATVAAVLINQQKELVTQEKEKVEKAHGETKIALANEAKALKTTESELRKATANRLAAQSQAMFDPQPQRAILLAIEAAEISRRAKEPEVPYVRQALLDHLSQVGGRVLGPLVGKNGAPLEVDVAAIAPEGNYVAAASGWRRHSDRQDPSGSTDIFVWNLSQPGKPQPVKLEGPTQEILVLRFSPDGGTLAAACHDGRVYFWKIAEPLAARPMLILDKPARPATLHPDDPAGAPWVQNIAFSTDGLLLAEIHRAGQVRVWKIKDGLPESEPWLGGLQKGTNQIPLPTLLFTLDQKQLITISPTANPADILQFHLWDLTVKAADAKPKAFPLGKGIIRSSAISPQGNQLAIGTIPGEVRVWPLTAEGIQGEPLVLRHQPGDVLAYNEIEGLAFSKDGAWLVTSAVADCRLWNLAEAKASKEPRPRGIYPPGRRLTMDPQGIWFAMGADSIATKFGDGRGVALHDFALLSSAAETSTFQMLAAGGLTWVQGNDGLREGRLIVSGPRAAETTPGITRLRGHHNYVVSLAASRQGRDLVSGDREGMLRVWDLTQSEPFLVPAVVPQQWGLRESCLAPQAGGMLMASIPIENPASQVTLWDLREERPRPKKRILERLNEARNPELGPTSDGKWLVRVGDREEVLLWDLSKGETPLRPRVLQNLPKHLFDRLNFLQALQMSGDRRWLAGAVIENNPPNINWKVLLWDLLAADPVAPRSIPWHGKPDLFSLSPQGSWLVMASQEGKLLFHHLKAAGGKEEYHELPLAGEHVSTILFSPNDERAYVGCMSGKILTWHIQERKLTSEFAGHEHPVTTLMVSPDGKLAATAAVTESPRLWRLENGKPTSSLILPLEEPGVAELAISPNGRWLVAAGGNDQPAVVWDLQAQDIPHSSVRLFRRWLPGDLVAGFVRFTPDSRYVITIGPTGARYWPLEMNDLLRLAKEAAGRELNAAEKAEYLTK